MTKFKDNILIKNIIILLTTGLVTKVIGMLGKIIYTRCAGVEIVSLYTLITPTLMLVVTLCQFSFPISISRLSAENKYDNKKLLVSAYFLGFTINIVVMLLVIIFSKKIAITLGNLVLYKAITAISFIIPPITITSIQRGFLHGKEDMFPASFSNIIEEIVKIILIIVVLPFAVAISNISTVITIILFNLLTELSSMIIQHNWIKKYIKKEKVSSDFKIIKDIISISLPTTLIRLISSVGFFLEPILLTYVLTLNGYSKEFIMLEYGIINSYVIPILLTPSFFSLSVASALLPNLTKEYTNKNHDMFRKKLIKLIMVSIIIGVICISIIILFPKTILKLIYGVSYGVNYVYIIGPFFILLYLQPALSATVQAIGRTNKLFYVSTFSTILKYLILYITGILGAGINCLLYSIITGIITTTLLISLIVLKELKKDHL